MPTVLLIFIIIFTLAIGFFLGLFLLSLDTPLTRTLTKKEDLAPEVGEQTLDNGPVSGVRKPTPGSRLILQIWKEEGAPPVYEINGEYLEKGQLPREFMNLFRDQNEIPSQAIPPQPLPPVDVIPAAVEDSPAGEPDDDDAPEELKALSVVEEVNDILQKKLIGSPMAGKGIHMMENHNKEIRFWVGLNSYDHVEEIPDPEVRQIINLSVKEWERNRE